MIDTLFGRHAGKAHLDERFLGKEEVVGSNPTFGSHAQFPSGAGRTAKRDVTPAGLATWEGYGYTVAGWGVKLPPWAACRVAPFTRKVAAWRRIRFEPVARLTPECSTHLPSSNFHSRCEYALFRENTEEWPSLVRHAPGKRERLTPSGVQISLLPPRRNVRDGPQPVSKAGPG